MTDRARQSFKYSWEEAVDLLRHDPDHRQLIFDAYLTSNLEDNCARFQISEEFQETMRIVRFYRPDARDLLDIPGGNGIATRAFASAGFKVTVVEPDASPSVGRGAIRYVLDQASVDARIVDARGESLPFPESSFDVVYVRQGLHHAANLSKMVSECQRVLRPDGLLLACREHVVDDHGPSLKAFLDSQVDHQLYGGENAFTLEEYRSAIRDCGLILREEIPPYDSPINLHPNTKDTLSQKILDSKPGRMLRVALPRHWVISIGLWRLRRSRKPGRAYSFVALKGRSPPPRC